MVHLSKNSLSIVLCTTVLILVISLFDFSSTKMLFNCQKCMKVCWTTRDAHTDPATVAFCTKCASICDMDQPKDPWLKLSQARKVHYNTTAVRDALESRFFGFGIGASVSGSASASASASKQVNVGGEGGGAGVSASKQVGGQVSGGISVGGALGWWGR